MSEPASISTGIAERYATAIFELAKDSDALTRLEANLTDLAAALTESADLRDLIASPLVSRSDQGRAIVAIADKMGLIAELKNGFAFDTVPTQTYAANSAWQILATTGMRQDFSWEASARHYLELYASAIASLG